MPISSKNNKTLSGTNLYTSSGTAIKPTITYNNGGTVTIGEGVFRLFHLPNYIGIITEHTISETILTISDNVTNYVVASYNLGLPEYSITTDLSSINFSDSVAVYTIFRIGDTNIDILDWDEPAYSLSNKILRRDMETRRFERISGLNLSEDIGRKILISSGAVWQGSYRNSRAEVNSIDNNCILVSSNALGEYEINSITAYNNTQYDTGTGLANVSDGNYVVNWIYRGMGINADSIIVYLGINDYDINEAKSAQPPNILLGTSTNAMLIGKFIVQKGSDTSIQIDSSFQTLFAPSASPNGVVIGSVQMFAGLVAPNGYFNCDGSAVSRTTYAGLFNTIGTTYGIGDGSTTFNLPNFKGRVPVGYDATQSEFNSIGETGGSKTHVLTTAEMASHTHTFTGNALPSHAHNYTRDGQTNQLVASDSVLGDDEYVADNVSDTSNNTSSVSAGTPSGTNSSEGGDTAFSIMNPYITLLYIIKY